LIKAGVPGLLMLEIDSDDRHPLMLDKKPAAPIIVTTIA
jgi:hypothetical protein